MKRRYTMTGQRCAHGAALAPLSRVQKTNLVLLAKEAFEIVEPESDFTTWRQEEALRAVGRQISTARNEDYLPLRAHFQNLMGRSGAAFSTHMRAEEDPRRQAVHALAQEAAKCKTILPDAIGYARGFLRKKGTTFEDASAKQIWNAVFTVRRKVQSLRHAERGTKAKRAPRVSKENQPF